MIIKTRKLPATSTDGERMRATADNGATLTLPLTYRNVDLSEWIATALMDAVSHSRGKAAYAVTRKGDNQWEMSEYA